MKLKDLFTGSKNEITIRVKPAIKQENFTKIDPSEVRISYSNNIYWLVDDKKDRIEIEGIGPEDKANLDLVISEQSISIVIEKKDHKLVLKTRLFNEKIIIDKIEIGYGDIILDDIDKRFSKYLKNNDKVQWLKNELLVQIADKTITLINNSPKENGFRLFGNNINVDISRKQDKYEIVKILKSSNQHKPSVILEANITIKDISHTALIKKEVFLQMSKIATNEQYLATWKKYQIEERKLTLKKVHDIGFLKIDKLDRMGNDKFKIYYKNDNNCENWINKISKNDFIELVYEKKFENKEDKIIKVQLIDKRESYIICKTDIDLYLKNQKKVFKYAILSTIGDDAIQSRRDDAIKLIETNQTPMPQLATILEGISTSHIERRKITSLTPKVKKEFGNFGPNEMQEEALDIALNTPDIAIIQGPPGTGKTKVITALAKRLVEDAKDKGIDFNKNILLTAFQHDAVENMASRTKILGLPAIKFGKKNSRVDVIDKWIKDTTDSIESEQYGMNQNEDEILSNDELTYENIKNHYISYIETLDKEKAKLFFNKFLKEYIKDLSIETLNKISLVTQKQIIENTEIINKLKRFVKNIRTNSISYEDDGKINLQRFIKRYNFYIEEKEPIPILEKSALLFMNELLKNDEICKEDFIKLENIKLSYLDTLTSNESVKDVNLPSIEIENLFKELIDIYAQKIKRSGSIYSVLSEYISDINSNKENVKKTIESYSTLLASTIQGSKNKYLMNIKADPFNTVIVDEAARANPLDLNIPLTSAKRRIVLVGDHRQLPHIIDDSIQNDLADDPDIAKDYRSHLEDSLFERLFTKLKELEKKDGIKRVVTLNTQYRMHPVLGNFISKTFYEKEGDPQILSGISADKLIHGIDKYKDKVAVSINIPNNMGKEEKYKGSTYRTVEAKKAIKVAKEILDEDPTLTVGVITFYSKQVEELYYEALHNNLVEKDEDDNYQIIKEYAKNQNQEERFRIGSVDAFQGKEFDVVILSLVRSNKNSTVKGKFGFLTSYNRLNVAMSRAKKLLITVGDEKMFKDNFAKEYVYGLYAFYKELIGGNNGISI
jgi:DNA polymerase III delta prime subunit